MLSVTLGSNYTYSNRALEAALMVQGYSEKTEVSIYYLSPQESESEILNKIKRNIHTKIPIHVLELNSSNMVGELNALAMSQDTLQHSLVEHTLVTSKFLSSFIFLNALLERPIAPIVPWGFVGLDIEKIAEAQLAHIRHSTVEYSTILVLLSEKETMFQSRWLKMLQKKKAENETIVTAYVKEASHEKMLNALLGLPDMQKTPLSVLTLSDETAIAAGVVLGNEMYKSYSKYPVVGFGGSPESLLAIERGIITMTIAPDYQEYSRKILALSKKLAQRIHQLLVQNYQFDRPQPAQSQEYVSFSIINASTLQSKKEKQ